MKRSELDTRLAAIRAGKAARAEALTRADAAEGVVRTVANLFSASTWALLPKAIKAYFADYRS